MILLNPGNLKSVALWKVFCNQNVECFNVPGGVLCWNYNYLAGEHVIDADNISAAKDKLPVRFVKLQVSKATTALLAHALCTSLRHILDYRLAACLF